MVAMSTTRLVVLGAIRQFQPVHGYFLRRELMSWHVDEWAKIQPGSIYNALRTLEADHYIESWQRMPRAAVRRARPIASHRPARSSCSGCCVTTSGMSRRSTPKR